MALDVSYSLATSLLQGDRAASARPSVRDKDSRGAQPEDFSASLDVAAARGGADKPASTARAATKARAHRAMPGQIEGHQDTVVSTQTSPVIQPLPRKGADVNVDVSVARKNTPAAKPTPCGGCETIDGSAKADAEGAGSNAVGENRPTGSAVGGEVATQPDTAEGAETEGSAAPDAAEAETLAVQTGVAGESVATPVPVPVASVGSNAQTAVGQAAPIAVGQVGAGPAGAAGIEVPAPEAVNLAAQATASAEATEEGSTPAAKSQSESSAQIVPDTKSQPGMTQQVAARAKAAGEADSMAAGKGQEGVFDAADKSSVGDAAGKAAPAHEAPALRGAVFQQVLEGFSHPGLHRAASVLSTLDPAVAAQAQNAHTHALERPTPLQLLPVEIGMQAVRGAREFQIRLDPAELGRVDVKLHINDKGEVNATMIVERPETLQMLRRDAQTLAQAFDQAGLKQGENALSFSLKGEGQQGQNQQQGHARAGYGEDDPSLTAQVNEIAMRRVMIPNSSLDLMV